ncbi:hypothetical protein GCM10027164_37970 [Algoriphagus taiwanensis]
MQGYTLKVCLDLERGEKLSIVIPASKEELSIANWAAMDLVSIMLKRVQMLCIDDLIARKIPKNIPFKVNCSVSMS